jgi:YidC/Oxa1 family membrane protein insertase
MDKRTIVAVLLMFAVLMIWNFVFMPKRKPQAPPPEAAPERQPTEVVDRPDSVSGVSVEPGSITLPDSEVEEQEAVVRTPLYTATFSTRGAVLTSFRLNEYLSDEDDPVELVPQAERLPLGNALLTQAGDRIDLAGAVFEASREVIDLDRTAEASLTFELVTDEGLVVTKTCRFRGDTYAIGLDMAIGGPLSRAVRALEIGWQSGLPTTEPNTNDDLRYFASVTLTEEGLTKKNRGAYKKQDEIAVAGDVRWSGVKSKYFFAGLVPLGDQQVVARSFKAGDDFIGMLLEADRTGPEPQEFLLYAGPLDYNRLKAMDLDLEKAMDFGWRVFAPLSKLIFSFMLLVHRVVPNYGLVIILLSGLTKLLFWPLTHKSFKSMREMQKLQPAMEALKEKHKGDAQKLNKAIMDLYRERKVNPLGGCLPMLLQMPVFISLFHVLSKTIELRQAPFVFWINDLSTPDVIAKMPFSLPFIGNNLSLLPILMGVAMFIQQKMSTSDPKQKAMTYMMPIIFTVFFFRFPSGLVLYWLVNNVLTIGHQYLMARAEQRQAVPTTGG